MGERDLSDIHRDLEAHVQAGTLTAEIFDALLAEEEALSPGGVLECFTSWLDAAHRAGLKMGPEE